MYLTERAGAVPGSVARDGAERQDAERHGAGRDGTERHGDGRDGGGREGTQPGAAGRSGVSRRGRVVRMSVLLGLCSMFTDISSEAVTAVLPLYLTAVLGMSPLAYGFIDGLYQGVSAVVRIAAGAVADRTGRRKWVAFGGYAASAVSRLALIPAQGFIAVTAVITADRLGKGIRTGPRDAMIAAAAPPEALGRNFGVHRALDTLGAMLGPILAFVILWALPGDYTSVFVASFAVALIGLAVLGLLVPEPGRAAAPASRGPGRGATGSRRGASRTRRVTSAPLRALRWRGGPGRHRPPQVDASERGLPAWRLLRSAGLGRIVLVAGGLGLLSIGDGFLYLALLRRSDFAAAYFPLLYVGTNAAYLLLAVPFGRLADRWGRARVFLLGHVPLALAYALVAAPLAGLAALVPVLALLGLYYAATDGVVAALASRVVPPERYASGIATVQTAVAAARFGASVGFGLLWTAVGPAPALVGLSAALVVGLLAGWRVLRPLDRRVTVRA